MCKRALMQVGENILWLVGLSMYGVQLRCSLLPAKAGKAAKAGPIAERSAMLFTHKGTTGTG